MIARFLCRLDVVLGFIKTPRAAAVAALLIALPTLFSGFLIDDHIHLLTLDGRGYGASPFDLFQFGTGDPEAMAALMRSGPYPWYTLPTLKLHFFRPLSSALMVLDRSLFGEAALFYHLHSALWYALLAWGAGLLYRRALPGPVLALAMLVFVLDTTHLIPTLWWSNRNSLVAAAPALFGLVAHVRWRETGWKAGLPLSLLGYGLGLLGGEGALGILGYVLAYEAIARRDGLAFRGRAVAPGLLLAGVYLALYKGLGHGVFGSGIYLDPVSEWAAFLANAPGRFAELVAVQFFGVPVELAVISDRMGHIVRFVSLIAATGAFATLFVLWRRLPDVERRAAAWLGVGALIATVPSLATFPSGRLLALPSVGACALIALTIHHGLSVSPGLGRRLLRGSARTLVAVHLVLAPLVWIGASVAIPIVVKAADGAFDSRPWATDGGPEPLELCLYAPDPYTGLYPPAMRRRMGYPDAGGWQCFSVAPFDHAVTRTAQNQFEIRVLGGELLSTPFERLMRSPAYPFRAGDRVALGAYTIEVIEAGRWGPSRFRVTFAASLEDARYRFVVWRSGALAPFVWPAIGETSLLSAEDGYFAWPHFKKRLRLL